MSSTTVPPLIVYGHLRAVQREVIARHLDVGMLGVGIAMGSSAVVMGAGLVLRERVVREIERVEWGRGLCVVERERFALMVRRGSVAQLVRLRVRRGHVA